jgi:hypothetical protein
MKLQAAKDAAEKVRRLERLNEMFDHLAAAGPDYEDLTLAGLRQSAALPANRLLRVVSDEIQELAKELQALGVQGLRIKELA